MTSLSFAASGLLGMRFPPRAAGMLFFPCVATSKSATSAVGGAPLLDRSAPRNTTAFRRQPPRGRLRWSLLRPLPGGHTHALLLSSWCPWDPGGCTRPRTSCGWCPIFVKGSKIERPSPFQVENNKTSRDVKGLFLGVRFVSSQVIVISWLGWSSMTICMSWWGVVLEYVMGLAIAH
jgi:hypothetical protein